MREHAEQGPRPFDRPTRSETQPSERWPSPRGSYRSPRTRGATGPRRPGRPPQGAFVAATTALLLILTTALALPAGAVRPSVGTASDVYLNVSATAQYGFTPTQLTVPPGATVHLAVTQLATFNHTFTLSSVANATIPISDTPGQLYAYFQAHLPIVNLSLGDVAGVVTRATFTAPPVGSYEFVCTVPTHFQGGMHGVLISGTGSGGSSSAFPLSSLELALAAIAVVIVVVVVAIRMRRRPASPTGAPAAPGKPT